MNYKEFVKKVKEQNIIIRFDERSKFKEYKLTNEALFQIPFIAMIILLLSKGTSKPLVAEIGQVVGECIELSMDGFKGSSKLLGWSANLRMRTVNALTFLEAAKLVDVKNRKDRIRITNLGKKVVKKGLSGDTDLAYSLAMIQRNYRNICSDKKLDKELI